MKKQIKGLLLLGSFVGGVFLSTAPAMEKQSPLEVLKSSNQNYEKNDWAGALEGYRSLIRQGLGGPSLYYNMGNVFFRKGDRGQAILWYERAKRLAPRDNDIQFNLTLARSHLKDDDDSIVEKIFLFFTTSELAWTLTFLSWFFFILLSWLILGKGASFLWTRTALWFSGILLTLVAGWFVVNVYLVHQPWGVVVSPPGEVRNGPGNDYGVGFTVPEGTKILLLDSRPDWVQVGVPQQGLKGWMPAGEVEPIIPRLVSSS